MTGFWDKRRASVAAEQEAETRAAAQAAARKADAEFDALPDAEILAKFDLPEPEALDSTEAVKRFMSHALPQRLKTRALRRLWRLNPVFANLDGLVDYDQDFTDAATVVENLQTGYRVGKGMLAHTEHLAKAEAEAAALKESAEDGAPETSGPEAEPDTDTEADTPAQVYAFQDDADAAPATGPSRRRMTFQFETNT